MPRVRLVLVSDTHLRPPAAIPDGDILVHAGDFTLRGTHREVLAVSRWLAGLPHPHKVVIAGNHDWLFEHDPGLARAALGPDVVYLQDEAAVVAGLRFWGAPWTPRFFDWAFNLDRGAPLRRKWAPIPEGLDVLVTHGPPWGILDRTFMGMAVGCEELAEVVQRTRPRLHVFGHIHEAHGVERHGETVYVNASTGYEAESGAEVWDLDV